MVNPAKQSNIVAFFGFKNPDLLKVYPWNCQHCVREVPTVLLPFPHPGWAGSPYHRRAALYLPPVTFPSPLALLILSVVLTQQDDSPTEDIKELLQPISTFPRANLSNPTPHPHSSDPGLLAPSRGQPSLPPRVMNLGSWLASWEPAKQ